MLALRTTRPRGLTPPVTGKSKLADLAAQAAWKSHWPKTGANILGVFMFIFGLALAGLEIANLVVGNDIGSSIVPDSLLRAISQSKRFRIGVGIWSGAVVALAAIAIFIINCKSKVKRWVHVAFSFTIAGLLVAGTNIGINANLVAIGVSGGGFNSENPTSYRLAAAQLTASSSSFILCLAFLLMYFIVKFRKVNPEIKWRMAMGLPQ